MSYFVSVFQTLLWPKRLSRSSTWAKRRPEDRWYRHWLRLRPMDLHHAYGDDPHFEAGTFAVFGELLCCCFFVCHVCSLFVCLFVCLFACFLCWGGKGLFGARGLFVPLEISEGQRTATPGLSSLWLVTTLLCFLTSKDRFNVLWHLIF